MAGPVPSTAAWPVSEHHLRRKILIVVAPFGYGPASKGLLIAQALADSADITVVSSRDAYRFIERFKAGDVVCREGIFHTAFADAADLAPYDLCISINNEPAVHHLIGRGLEARTLFVDSILPWRSMHSRVSFRRPILGYLVQDFPGVASCMAECRAQTVELTAPMVWSRPRGDASAAQGSREVVLHVGGVTSPLVHWEMLRRPVEVIVQHALALARRTGRTLTVIGSRHLDPSGTTGSDDFRILGDISPPETARLLGGAELLLSTPGIGAVYEAMACGVPTIVLPPMNSTQLMQYGVFSDLGFPGSMSNEASTALRETARSIPWDGQTAHCVRFVNLNLSACLAELPRHMLSVLAAGGAGLAYAEAQRVQAAFFAGLSTTSATDIIRRFLFDESRPARP